MAKASNNEFPSVLFDEQATAPTTPGSGLWRAYFKSDGLYIVDDAGTETGPLGAAGSSVTKQVLWLRKNANQTGLTAAAYNDITWQVEHSDDWTGFDSATSQTDWTVPATDWYWYRLIFKSDTSAQDIFNVRIWNQTDSTIAANHSGSILAGKAPTGGLPGGIESSGPVLLTTGKTYRCQAYMQTGTGIQGTDSASSTEFVLLKAT